MHTSAKGAASRSPKAVRTSTALKAAAAKKLDPVFQNRSGARSTQRKSADHPRVSAVRLIDHYTELRPSALHGMGLFAKRDIPANTVWWKARRSRVLLINRSHYGTLLGSELNPIMGNLLQIASHYGYYSARLDSIVVCLDNARYVNHSFQPNSGAPTNGDPLSSMTLRAIRAGEEILEDYSCYDACPWSTITCCEAFLCSPQQEPFTA